MDHENVVRLKATERYLLNELNPDQRDQFEEHVFDCPDCTLDVRAAAMFVEQSKNLLSETHGTVLVTTPPPVRKDWFSWLRPAFVVPALASLLAIVSYQNLVTVPHLHEALSRPHVLPWALVSVGTKGTGGPVVAAALGGGFMLMVRIPPEDGYVRYTADLYNPAGKLEWSLPIPAKPGEDQYVIEVPEANRVAGNYTLAIRGVTAVGESKDLGRTSFELQIQK